MADVKKEPNYISIEILVDPSDKSNILLFEKWASADYYKGGHMKTPHLQQFMADARTFFGWPAGYFILEPGNQLRLHTHRSIPAAGLLYIFQPAEMPDVVNHSP